MKISVVTICFNAKSTLEETLNSVISQTYKNIDYVIIDGSSTDGSVELLRQYAEKYDNIKLVSEPDTGIYNAMNKGVRNAEGEYVFFLNAGDVFASENVIEKFVSSATDDKDIYYGDIIFGKEPVTQPAQLSLFSLIWLERMICHQSIFAKRRLLLAIPFDETYKINGDRVWLIEALKAGAGCRHITDFPVAVYDINGLSSVYENFSVESLRIGKQFAGRKCVVFIHLKRKVGKVLRKIKGK